MKRLIYILILAVALIGCRGAQHATPEGVLRIEEIGVEAEVTPLGKALQAVNPTSLLSTTITDADGQIVKRFAKGEVLPPTVPLRAGAYRIESSTADPFPQAEARFETPLYQGAQEFEIHADQVTSIALVCTEQTASVEVGYSDEFKSIFPADRYRYWVVLTSSIGARITVEATQTEAAFFRVPTPDVELFYSVFLQQKNASGGWDDLWGEAEGLTRVSFRIDPKNGTSSVERGVRYRVTVGVRQ